MCPEGYEGSGSSLRCRYSRPFGRSAWRFDSWISASAATDTITVVSATARSSRARLQIAVATGEARWCEAEIELTVSSGEVPHARSQQAPRREVVRWQCHPAAQVDRVGDELAAQFVQRIGQPGEVLWRGVRGEVDVLGVEAASVGLDRGAADQHERNAMTHEHAEQRFPVGIYATGICSLSQAWILSWSVWPSAVRSSSRARWTSSTAP